MNNYNFLKGIEFKVEMRVHQHSEQITHYLYYI